MSPQLKARLRFAPSQPGAYIMRDETGRIIYVGKARDLRRRLGDYFLRGNKEAKVETLLSRTSDFEVHTCDRETEALRLEEKLIQEFLPRYNITLRWGRARYFITSDPEEELPRLDVVRAEGAGEGGRRRGRHPSVRPLRVLRDCVVAG